MLRGAPGSRKSWSHVFNNFPGYESVAMLYDALRFCDQPKSMHEFGDQTARPSEHLLAHQDLGSSRSRQDDQVDLLLQRKKTQRRRSKTLSFAVQVHLSLSYMGLYRCTTARMARMAWALDMEEIRSQPPTENGCVKCATPKKNGVASLPRQDCQFMQFWDKRSNSDPHRKDNEFRGLNSWVLYPAALRPAFLAPEVLWEWRHSNVDHTWESTAKALQTCDLTNFGPSQQ